MNMNCTFDPSGLNKAVPKIIVEGLSFVHLLKLEKGSCQNICTKCKIAPALAFHQSPGERKK